MPNMRMPVRLHTLLFSHLHYYHLLHIIARPCACARPADRLVRDRDRPRRSERASSRWMPSSPRPAADCATSGTRTRL